MPRLLFLALLLLLVPGCSTTTRFPHQPLTALAFAFPSQTKEYDTPPVFLSGRMPEYPLVARIHHEWGAVHASFLIDVDGRTKQILFEKNSTPALAFALDQAIRQWHFEPARKAGKAVPAHVRFSLNFQVPLRERNSAPPQHSP